MVVDLFDSMMALVSFALCFFLIAFGWHWTRCVVEDTYKMWKLKNKK